jgi:hypothetical protein
LKEGLLETEILRGLETRSWRERGSVVGKLSSLSSQELGK